MTLTTPNPVFKVTAFLKLNIAPVVSISWASCYPRDVVSAIYATATWLGGWLAGWVGGCLFVTAGIVSKRLNLS